MARVSMIISPGESRQYLSGSATGFALIESLVRCSRTIRLERTGLSLLVYRCVFWLAHGCFSGRSPGAFGVIAMAQPKHLLIGGLVAMGFDATGKYLLTVSHSGRGVFSTDTWERVARDSNLAYSADGKAVGIGPLQGQVIGLVQRDERRDRMEMQSPDGRYHLVGESDGI